MIERKILCVDDSAVNREYLHDCIDTYFPNTLVYEAVNGEEAVLMCTAQWFDLVLLDIMMPVMDGCEALKQIKKINPTIPVVMCTCYEAKYLETYARGADGFILKPFSPEEFKNVAEKYL